MSILWLVTESLQNDNYSYWDAHLWYLIQYSVTICFIYFQRKSFQKQSCGFTEKQISNQLKTTKFFLCFISHEVLSLKVLSLDTPVIELRSSNINLQQKEHQEQTALSVVMNILEADNHVDYTEMLWPLWNSETVNTLILFCTTEFHWYVLVSNCTMFIQIKVIFCRTGIMSILLYES